jgi:hypothetical protein
LTKYLFVERADDDESRNGGKGQEPEDRASIGEP